MAEINSTEVIIQPIVPKAIDDQQVIVYIPTANTGSYGVIKLETDDLNPDIIAENGILQLRNGRVLQTKVDIKEQQGYLYATPNDIILYTENADQNTIVYRNNDGNFSSGDADSDEQVVNLRVLKRELGKALIEYDALNLKNGTGDILIQTTDLNHSFKVMKDGRTKVYGEPTESDDVLRLNEFSVLTQEQVDSLF